jgi:hypothetical protein
MSHEKRDHDVSLSMSGEDHTYLSPDQPSCWNEEDFAQFVTHHRWRFARTMLSDPHEYTLRRNALSATFDDAVRYIREHGYTEYYGGRPYQALYFGDHKYWTMGAALPETILINRKPRFADVRALSTDREN